MCGCFMDIFTTQLTRVQQTPIKPSKLKVKALVKEPSTKVLSDDIDHNENHEQYFEKNEEKSKQKQHSSPQVLEAGINSPEAINNEDGTEKETKPPHLDLYV